MWYETLSEDVRERLWAWMRRTDDEYQQLQERERRLTAPAGMLAVGSAHIDPFVYEEGTRVFLSALRNGETPETALECAKSAARDCVKIHNAKRPKDVNWQRFDGMADGRMHALYASLKYAIK